MIVAPPLNASARRADRAQASLRAAIRAAEQLLADTVDEVNPDTPPRTLLACTEQYRAQLAALVAACRSHAD